MRIIKDDNLDIAEFETTGDAIMVNLGDNYTVVIGSKGVLIYRDGDLENTLKFNRVVTGLEIKE